MRAGFRALLKETVPAAQIHEAAGYGQAVAILANANIDFAFLDVKLKDGEKTGLDVLHYKRLHNLDTRVIMLSAHVEKDLVQQCLDAGALGYIPKYMEGDGVLREALETVFQDRLFLPASILGHEGGGVAIGQNAGRTGCQWPVA